MENKNTQKKTVKTEEVQAMLDIYLQDGIQRASITVYFT